MRATPEVVEERLHAVPEDRKERGAKIESMLREVGCDGDALTTQKVGGSRAPNVICTLPGETDSTILVGAHFDASGRGDGVVDNWSGASLLPTLYDSIRKAPRRHTYVFVGFAAEEKGLYGSRRYINRLSKEDRARIRAMVSIDSIGLGPTKVWASHSDPALLDLLDLVAASASLSVSGVNAEQIGTGDHAPFREKRVPCVVIHSVTQETLSVLHSREDNLSAIQFDDYYDTYVLLATYLAYLDLKLE